MTTRLTLNKTGWRFYEGVAGNPQTTSSGSRANLQTASSSSSIGTKPIEDEQLEFSAFFKP